MIFFFFTGEQTVKGQNQHMVPYSSYKINKLRTRVDTICTANMTTSDGVKNERLKTDDDIQSNSKPVSPHTRKRILTWIVFIKQIKHIGAGNGALERGWEERRGGGWGWRRDLNHHSKP